MANLVRTFKKAAKTALNPVSSTKVAISMANPVNTFKAVNNSATKNVAAALLNPNPVSNDKLAVTRALVNPNPIKTTTQLANIVSTTANQQSGTQKRVVPDRSSYSASAGAGAAAAAANAAAAQKVEEYKKTIPDRATYSANAGANEAIRNIAQEKSGAQSRGAAWDNAATAAAENSKDSNDPEQTARYIENAYPAETWAARQGAGYISQGENMEQQLPEVYVQSDFKKYFIFGCFALAGIVLWKKLK